MPGKYVSCNLEDILVGEPLPATVYIYIDFRFITYRAGGDVVDRAAFERLQSRGLNNLFVLDEDQAKFDQWVLGRKKELASHPVDPAIAAVKAEAHRKMLDIFQSKHPDRGLEQAMGASKKIVFEMMKTPYAVRPLAQLQGYSRGVADHSVNVSVLSVYLGLQTGYTHEVILQHLAAGALLHDLGKSRIEVSENDSPATVTEKMRFHAVRGVEMFDPTSKVPTEVKMIIGQHHEYFDGSGYPDGLKGNHIYDLARLVSIANAFDELVSDGTGPLQERQRAAILQFETTQRKKFDPVKLEKALRVLRLGI